MKNLKYIWYRFSRQRGHIRTGTIISDPTSQKCLDPHRIRIHNTDKVDAVKIVSVAKTHWPKHWAPEPNCRPLVNIALFTYFFIIQYLDNFPQSKFLKRYSVSLASQEKVN
jgi:hypothetical protein